MNRNILIAVGVVILILILVIMFQRGGDDPEPVNGVDEITNDTIVEATADDGLAGEVEGEVAEMVEEINSNDDLEEVPEGK